MARHVITFQLRKDKDDDIATNLTKYITVENDQSSIIRTALRNYFNSLNRSSERATRHIVEETLEGVVLQTAEKDDTQLDDALDSWLQS